MVNSDLKGQEEKRIRECFLVGVAFEPWRLICKDYSHWRRKGRTCRPDGAAHLGNSKHSGVAGIEGAWGDLVSYHHS